MAESLELTPAFKVLLALAVGLTTLMFLTMVGLAITDAKNEASKTLLQASASAFQLGFGALIGLIGGRLTT
jgi:hypothetical protein